MVFLFSYAYISPSQVRLLPSTPRFLVVYQLPLCIAIRRLPRDQKNTLHRLQRVCYQLVSDERLFKFAMASIGPRPESLLETGCQTCIPPAVSNYAARAFKSPDRTLWGASVCSHLLHHERRLNWFLGYLHL